MPKPGDICRCSRGQLGMITAAMPETDRYDDGSVGTAWVGVHLEGEKIGGPWSSRNPVVVGTMEDAIIAWETHHSCEHATNMP